MNIGTMFLVPQDICPKNVRFITGTNISWKKWLLESLKLFLWKQSTN